LVKHSFAGPEIWRKLLILDMINDMFIGMFQLSLVLLILSTHPRRLVACWCLFVFTLIAFSAFFFDKRFRVWRKLGYSLANPDAAMEA
jgi:hypothetical protein